MRLLLKRYAVRVAQWRVKILRCSGLFCLRWKRLAERTKDWSSISVLVCASCSAKSIASLGKSLFKSKWRSLYMLMSNSFEKLLPVKDDDGKLTAILNNMRANKDFMGRAQRYASLRQLVVGYMFWELQWKQSNLEASHASVLPGGATLVPNSQMIIEWYSRSRAQ